jgi:CheY-like chemotaxis protein
VLSAEDGPSCLALADQCDLDLVLLDVLMPGMSGWDVARALRRSGHDRVSIVMLSANAGESHNVLSPDRVHDGYLLKPIDIRQLLDKIHSLLKVEWTYEAAEEAASPAQASVSIVAPPPAEHIHDLMKLGEIGHVRGIQAKLFELEDKFPEHQVFVTQMRGIVNSFDLRRYMAVLEAFRHDDAR